MRISEDYDLFEIGGVPYVLPWGQNIADHKRGFRLNESGLVLWKGISAGADFKGLVNLLAEYYEAEPEDKNILKTDVKEFLDMLEDSGVLYNDNLCKNDINQVFTIGNIRVKIISPKEFVHKNLFSFENSQGKEIDLKIQIKREYPKIRENGQILIRNRELWVIRNTDKYIFLFPEAEQIIEGHLSIDGKNGCFYVRGDLTEKLKEDLFHALRLLYLYKAQINGMYMVHSASILYDDKVWLFSAPSGVGKSTHTCLWHEQFNTPYVNGDLNMLAIENGRAVVHGIPWCGTSEIFDTKTYPLGGIVFLKRGDTNVCEEMVMEEKALSLMQRMISPSWTKYMLDKNLRFAEKIAEKVPICRLYCTKEPEAAEIIKNWIDKE